MFTTTLCTALVACAAATARAQEATADRENGFAQELGREALAELEWGGARSLARTKPLRERAEGLDAEGAAELRARLAADPEDLVTRMVLLFHELPELRRKRGERPDPKPHGELVLGLIEEHPRSPLAGMAGLLLYPYKRDGMYTGPAWEGAIELWERLVREYPEDPAIACNAGSFLMADPFRMELDGPRALALLRRARELDPGHPRWALQLGAYHSMRQSMTREPKARAAHARAALPHLRAAWDRTEAAERAALSVAGEPLTMVLAHACFDAGETEPARSFAALALEGVDPEQPRGDVVFEMNALLGRIALAAGDTSEAARRLLAAGETSGSAVLGSFGPDMTLAKELIAAGERGAVLEFLESCKVFWHSGGDELDSWIRAIEGGGNPWEDRLPSRR